MLNSSLGQLLVQEGLLSEDDRQTIRRTCGSGPWAFAKGVLALGLLDEDELTSILADKTNFKVCAKDLISEHDSEVFRHIDPALAARLEVFPLSFERDTLKIAMADPLDRNVLRQVEFFTQLKVRPMIASLREIRRCLTEVVKGYKQYPTELEAFLMHHANTAARTLQSRAFPTIKREGRAAKRGASASSINIPGHYTSSALDDKFATVDVGEDFNFKTKTARDKDLASLGTFTKGGWKIELTPEPVEQPKAQKPDANNSKKAEAKASTPVTAKVETKVTKSSTNPIASLAIEDDLGGSSESNVPDLDLVDSPSSASSAPIADLSLDDDLADLNSSGGGDGPSVDLSDLDDIGGESAEAAPSVGSTPAMANSAIAAETTAATDDLDLSTATSADLGTEAVAESGDLVGDVELGELDLGSEPADTSADAVTEDLADLGTSSESLNPTADDATDGSAELDLGLESIPNDELSTQAAEAVGDEVPELELEAEGADLNIDLNESNPSTTEGSEISDDLTVADANAGDSLDVDLSLDGLEENSTESISLDAPAEVQLEALSDSFPEEAKEEVASVAEDALPDLDLEADSPAVAIDKIDERSIESLETASSDELSGDMDLNIAGEAELSTDLDLSDSINPAEDAATTKRDLQADAQAASALNSFDGVKILGSLNQAMMKLTVSAPGPQNLPTVTAAIARNLPNGTMFDLEATPCITSRWEKAGMLQVGTAASDQDKVVSYLKGLKDAWTWVEPSQVKALPASLQKASLPGLPMIICGSGSRRVAAAISPEMGRNEAFKLALQTLMKKVS